MERENLSTELELELELTTTEAEAATADEMVGMPLDDAEPNAILDEADTVGKAAADEARTEADALGLGLADGATEPKAADEEAAVALTLTPAPEAAAALALAAATPELTAPPNTLSKSNDALELAVAVAEAAPELRLMTVANDEFEDAEDEGAAAATPNAELEAAWAEDVEMAERGTEERPVESAMAVLAPVATTALAELAPDAPSTELTPDAPMADELAPDAPDATALPVAVAFVAPALTVTVEKT